ncbi:uncharacterized protein LOC130709967 [Lotus japonicus]|uniref:uncharacterized protein LOC130709967 n=1 Tax=Lotus japonicus TaxID=34305 RepID=UPI00258C663A|nr:uncharacterized protein LOC130709967 [Lotus japonicus]
MASVLNERSGDQEPKTGWKGNALSSISAPPLQLLAIVGIVVFLLWVSSHMNSKSAMETTSNTNVNLFLLFLPLVITLIAQFGRFGVAVPATNNNATTTSSSYGDGDEGPSPWGWVPFVVLLLVLISNQLHPFIVMAIVSLYMYVVST